MGRSVAALVFVCLLNACQATPPKSADVSYELVDLTDDYARYWDRTRTMDGRERIAAFKQEFATLLPDFYGSSRFPNMTPERFDQRISRALERFPAIRAEYTRTAASFENMMRPAIVTFRRAFPDMHTMVPVYLLHSLGEMDGATRTLDGRLVLVFGADVMVSAHEFDDEEPFLHHELFHVYHQRYFPGCDQVWCDLWSEGLAVFVAQQLNPDASDAQLLLMKPEPIRPQVDARLEEAVCAVRTLLDSSAAGDVRALFSFERLNVNVPPRAGYYIGYLAAQRAAATRSVAELARLTPAEVRPVLEQAMDALAACK